MYIQKTATYIFLPQTENGSLFSLVGKKYMVIDICGFRKRAHLRSYASALELKSRVQPSVAMHYLMHHVHIRLIAFLLSGHW
jgi:hypothetical protein